MDEVLVSIYEYQRDEGSTAVFEHNDCDHGCAVKIPLGNLADLGMPRRILVYVAPLNESPDVTLQDLRDISL